MLIMMTYLTRLAWQQYKYDFKHPSPVHTHTGVCDKLAGAPHRVTLQLIWELHLDL